MMEQAEAPQMEPKDDDDEKATGDWNVQNET
jgi:hypothetical protein